MKTHPSPAAVKAAEAIWQHVRNHQYLAEEVATLIDAEFKSLVEALESVAHTCTCSRPTIQLPGGGVRAPGPHTALCVLTIARQALATLRADDATAGERD